MKDLGQDILNLVPDLMIADPWEDEDAPLFPNLDNELTHVKAAEDNLINSEVLLPVEDFHSWPGSSTRYVNLTVCRLSP